MPLFYGSRKNFSIFIAHNNRVMMMMTMMATLPWSGTLAPKSSHIVNNLGIDW